MPNLISRATGNLLGTTTWAKAADGDNASQIFYNHCQTISTQTTYSPNIDLIKDQIIDGILLNVSRITTVGTMTVVLNDGVDDKVSCTIDVSSLPDGQTWACFKFNSSLITSKSSYKIGVSTSSPSTVTVHRNHTPDNFARLIRTTSQSSANSGDQLWIVGENNVAFKVVIDSTVSTTNFARIEIGHGGTLAYGVDGDAHYALSVKDAPINIFANGSMTMGTHEEPMPLSSIAELFINSIRESPITIHKNGAFRTCGPSKTLETMLTDEGTIDLEQSVKIRSIYCGHFEIKNGGIVDCSYTHFDGIGNPAVFVMPAGSIADVNISNCSIQGAKCVLILGEETAGYNMSNTVVHNTESVAVIERNSISNPHTINNNTILMVSDTAFKLFDHDCTITNNIVSDCRNAFEFVGSPNNCQNVSNFSGNVASSCKKGFSFDSLTDGSGILSDCKSLQNEVGLHFDNTYGPSTGLIFDNWTIIGQTTGIELKNTIDLNFINCNVDGESAVSFNGQTFNTIFENCLVGTASISGSAFSYSTSKDTFIDATFRNCLFGSEPAKMPTTVLNTSKISSQNHNRSQTESRVWLATGMIKEDAVYVKSTPLRASPNSFTRKTEISVSQIAVKAGDNINFNVYVRKSSSSDGCAYNGSAPRLIAKANSCIGVLNDAVIAKDASAGSFSLMTGKVSITGNGIIEFIVDCDGTSGWITIDDAFVS
jgi:hypothetical protein